VARKKLIRSFDSTPIILSPEDLIYLLNDLITILISVQRNGLPVTQSQFEKKQNKTKQNKILQTVSK